MHLAGRLRNDDAGETLLEDRVNLIRRAAMQATG
jgi:hypothetical protein